jgi:hypothetical protein
MPPEDPVEAPAGLPTDAPELPSGHEEAFGALDAMAKEMDSPVAPVPAPIGDKRERGTDGKFLKAGEKPKPVEKPAEKPEPKVDPKAEIDFEKPPERVGDLRKHYDALKARHRELETKHAELQKTSQAPREWPEEKTYKEKLAEREKSIEAHGKRIADYESELRFVNYRKSEDYKHNFEKPYVDAFLAGRDRAKNLKIIQRKTDADPENGIEAKIVQESRQGKPEDFDEIMSIVDDDLAAERAAELYGPTKASVILWHREQVNARNIAANNAVKEYQEKGAEWEKQRAELSSKQMETATKMIEDFRTAAVEKYPALFKPDDSDPKGNELLEAGSHLLNRVLKGGSPIKDGERQMTQEEMAIAISAVRNKAAAFDRVAYKANALAKENKALKAELSQFKASVPGNGEGNGRTATPEEDSPMAKLAKMGRERPS